MIKESLFALLLSLFAHALVLLWLWNQNDHKDSAIQTITVNYQNANKPAGEREHFSNQDRKNQEPGKSRLQTIPLSSLMPDFSFRPLKKTEKSKHSDPRLTWKNSQFYDGISSSESNNLSAKQISFAQSLWRAIDRNIEENPYLSEYNRTGKAFFHFKVDHGRLVPKSLKASAPDRVLKVIAARALRAALRNDSGDVHFPVGSLWINARFSWSDYKACKSLRGVRGNNLSFCHYAENKRKTFSTGEKTATWMSSIYQHGPWAYEEIKKYNRQERRRKFKFNPFEGYEHDPDWNL